MENQFLRESVVGVSIKVFLGLCVLGYLSHLLGNSAENYLVEDETQDEKNSSTISDNNVTLVTVIENPKPIILQPHCKPLNMEIALRLVVTETFHCRPEDMMKEKQKILLNKKKIKIRDADPEATESMVIYIAVGLLLVSLGAALLEVFKFAHQPTAKMKPALNRSCSLADLTVMRHTRKELMRRDSMMEGVGPSKLLDRHSPLYRRCSFPVGPGDSRHSSGHFDPDFYGGSGMHGSRSSSRKTSIDVDGNFFHTHHRHAHIRLLHRH